PAPPGLRGARLVPRTAKPQEGGERGGGHQRPHPHTRRGGRRPQTVRQVARHPSPTVRHPALALPGRPVLRHAIAGLVREHGGTDYGPVEAGDLQHALGPGQVRVGRLRYALEQYAYQGGVQDRLQTGSAPCSAVAGAVAAAAVLLRAAGTAVAAVEPAVAVR